MRIRLIFLLAVSVLFCSCSLFKAPVFERINDVQLNDLTPDHTTLDISIVITNPNWYSITVKKLQIEVEDRNREKLGNIVMTQPLKMERHEADTVYFEIRMDTRKVAKLLSYSSQKVEFTVKAEALAKVFGISKRVKLEQRQEINFTKIVEDLLPSISSEVEIPAISTNNKTGKLIIRDPDIKPPNNSPFKPDMFKVIKTSVTDISFKETELTVKFMLLNPYGLAFTFRDFPSDVWINDKYAGKGRLSKPLVFTENVFSAEGEIIFDLNNFNSLLLASGALIKKDLRYLVNGTLMVDGFGTKISKPFKFRGTVEIGKKDKSD
jgi:LEA14-like dessication related protein